MSSATGWIVRRAAMALLLVACSSERAELMRLRGSYAGAGGGPEIGAAGAAQAGTAGTSGAGSEGIGPSAGTAGWSILLTETNCRDGVDNDGDARSDCADPDCAGECAGSCENVPELVSAGVLGSLTGQPDDFDLGCGPGGPELVYRYSAKRDGELSLRLSSAADLRIGVRSGCASGKQLACDDATVTVPVEAGVELFVVVEGNGDEDDAPTFVLSMAGCGDGVLDPGEQCDDGGRLSGDGCSKTCALESSEGPDNDTVADADELSGDRYFGSIEDSADVDLVHLAIASRQAEIRVVSSDLGGGCGSGASTTLELLSSEGELLDVDEGERPAGACAALLVSGLAPDDYYLRVASSSDASFAYILNITLATCGNALREPGELCDDGNTEDGDGCASDCVPD
jgi:cysteine-rich repeat protein